MCNFWNFGHLPSFMSKDGNLNIGVYLGNTLKQIIKAHGPLVLVFSAADMPSVPRNLRAVQQGSNRILVQWDPPHANNQQIVAYTVNYKKTSGEFG